MHDSTARNVSGNDDTKQSSSRGWTYAIIACVIALELVAMHGKDPDFFLPDPFRPFVIGLLVTFVVVDRIRSPRIRVPSLLILCALPLLVVLLEWRAATVDARNRGRVTRLANPILRFGYQPGLDVNERAADGTPIVITSDGLWDRPHTKPKPPGTYRVVILGDSVPNDPSIPFTSRFPSRIEALLKERLPNRTIEVLNVSCEGYNTVQEVELLERVGLAYEPDLVVLAYVLNDPFMQDGSYRRTGNSYFMFRVAPVGRLLTKGSFCPLFEQLHSGYGFELTVRHSLTRLRLLSEHHKFGVIIATLPIVERFDDPTCIAMYDRVLGIGREQGFSTVRVVDAFAGLNYKEFLKPHDPYDVTHPNIGGHERMAGALATAIITKMTQKSE